MDCNSDYNVNNDSILCNDILNNASQSSPCSSFASNRESGQTSGSFISPKKKYVKTEKKRDLAETPLGKIAVKLLYKIIHRYNYGIKDKIYNKKTGKKEDGVFFANPTDELIKSPVLNSEIYRYNRNVFIIGQKAIEKHIFGIKTYYYTSSISKKVNYLMPMIDIDYHSLQERIGDNDSIKLLNDINNKFFEGHLYHETSTSGKGIHSYFFVDISKKDYSERVNAVNMLRELGKTLNTYYKLNNYISTVEIKGLPMTVDYSKKNDIVEYGYRGIIEDDVNRGTLAKLPRWSGSLDIFNDFIENHSCSITCGDLIKHVDILKKEIDDINNKRDKSSKDSVICFSSIEEKQPDYTSPPPPSTPTNKHVSMYVKKITKDCGYKVSNLTLPPMERVQIGVRQYIINNGIIPSYEEFNILYEQLGLNTVEAEPDRIIRYNEVIKRLDITKMGYNDLKNYLLNKVSSITDIDINKINKTRYKITHEELAFIYYSILTKKIPETPIAGIQALHKSIYGHKLNRKGKHSKTTIANRKISKCFQILLQTGIIRLEAEYISPQEARKKKIKSKGKRYEIIK